MVNIRYHRKENIVNTYIQYTVKGLNAEINKDTIKLSYMNTSKPIPFFNVKKKIFKCFASIKNEKDIILFINEYGNIFKETRGNISLQKIKDEVEILRNIARMVTLLRKTEDANDLIEKIRNIDLEFLDNILRQYMEQLGTLDEYNNYDLWKNDKYKAGNAIKELLYITKNQYKIEKDSNEEYIFINLYGIPLYDLKNDVYYILNTLLIRILSNISLQTSYIQEEFTFRNTQKVNTLLEAIYLYAYNSLDTDNPIRNCNNPNCNKILIGEHIKKKYCCDRCRNNYNKKLSSNNSIKKLVAKYRQRAYYAYCNNKIDVTTQETIYKEILDARDKLHKNKIEEVEAYEKEFNKILKKYNILKIVKD